MVEFRPAGLGFWFWVGFGAFLPFSTICLFFPSFNDDLGTMPTRRPYSWLTTNNAGPCTAPDHRLLPFHAVAPLVTACGWSEALLTGFAALHSCADHAVRLFREFRPRVCQTASGLWCVLVLGFWLLFGVVVWFGVACVLFPSSCCISFLFNDDLGTPPTWRPHSWKKDWKVNVSNAPTHGEHQSPVEREVHLESAGIAMLRLRFGRGEIPCLDVHLARCLQFAMHKFRLSLFVKDLEPGSTTFLFLDCLKATCSESFERVLGMWRCFKRLLILFFRVFFV